LSSEAFSEGGSEGEEPNNKGITALAEIKD